MDTLNLDRLVEEGVTFTDCHVTAPSCAPSRASLFTGYYPHTTGIYKNGDRWTRSWVENLSESGYYMEPGHLLDTTSDTRACRSNTPTTAQSVDSTKTR